MARVLGIVTSSISQNSSRPTLIWKRNAFGPVLREAEATTRDETHCCCCCCRSQEINLGVSLDASLVNQAYIYTLSLVTSMCHRPFNPDHPRSSGARSLDHDEEDEALVEAHGAMAAAALLVAFQAVAIARQERQEILRRGELEIARLRQERDLLLLERDLQHERERRERLLHEQDRLQRLVDGLLARRQLQLQLAVDAMEPEEMGCSTCMIL